MYLMCGPRQLSSSVAQRCQKVGHPGPETGSQDLGGQLSGLSRSQKRTLCTFGYLLHLYNTCAERMAWLKAQGALKT